MVKVVPRGKFVHVSYLKNLELEDYVRDILYVIG